MARASLQIVDGIAALHRRLDACRACPDMIGPVVHGPAIASRIYAIGQAPGPHEGRIGRPFAWTAGRTLFRWFEEHLGVGEAAYRERVYIAAVARCFPGKDAGGGDRKPSPAETEACRVHIAAEVALLRPALVIAIGQVAIEQVLGRKAPLADVVGRRFRERFHGVELDVVCLPHPSGLSTWHKLEPGKTLLKKALRRIGAHPAWRSAFPPSRVTPSRATAPARRTPSSRARSPASSRTASAPRRP